MIYITLMISVMNVLRMVKLFGWERKMAGRMSNKREEELVWVKWRLLLDLLNSVVKCAFTVFDQVWTDTHLQLRHFCLDDNHHTGYIVSQVLAITFLEN